MLTWLLPKHMKHLLFYNHSPSLTKLAIYLSIYLFINFISPLGILVNEKCKQPEISIHEKFCPLEKEKKNRRASKHMQRTCEEASFR